MTEDLPTRWAERLGLAITPLFGATPPFETDNHHVMLDGGHGSFALSVGNELTEDLAAACSWSSDLPHHVTIRDKEVIVLRWDTKNTEQFTLSSVENQAPLFYEYLASSRIVSNARVVDHMLYIFRRIRSLVSDANLDDSKSIDVYLEFLVRCIETLSDADIQGHTFISKWNISHGDSFLSSLSILGLESLMNDAKLAPASERSLTLWPDLAVRHAGSKIFQEAHFELSRPYAVDLFGHSPPARSNVVKQSVTHFTPVALARIVVEQSLNALSELNSRNKLVILDPACGSGAFLHEALRTLREKGFSGHLTLYGYDISQSAVSMANFVISRAQDDWEPLGGCETVIQTRDSLETLLPPADVVLMNPPFVSSLALNREQRQQMRNILEVRNIGRADLSMAFVTHALKAMKPGGVLGTLLPASLFSLHAAALWREQIVAEGEVRLLASLGDYGLFTHALVQVGVLVLRKGSQGGQSPRQALAVATGAGAKETGDVLRLVRRIGQSGKIIEEEKVPRPFWISQGQFRGRPTWRLIPPATESAIQRLVDLGRVCRADELFYIRQGVRTGSNRVFVHRRVAIDGELPNSERHWFRPAILNSSIDRGCIRDEYCIFYPYGEGGLEITTLDQLRTAVPIFLSKYLKANEPMLASRRSLQDAQRTDWWGLSRPRSWMLGGEGRIVSKFFGGIGSFVADRDGRYVVVQGNAWLPKRRRLLGGVREGDGLTMDEMLCAYTAVLNSNYFIRLAGMFCSAGGRRTVGIEQQIYWTGSCTANACVSDESGRSADKFAVGGAWCGTSGWAPRMAG